VVVVRVTCCAVPVDDRQFGRLASHAAFENLRNTIADGVRILVPVELVIGLAQDLVFVVSGQAPVRFVHVDVSPLDVLDEQRLPDVLDDALQEPRELPHLFLGVLEQLGMVPLCLDLRRHHLDLVLGPHQPKGLSHVVDDGDRAQQPAAFAPHLPGAPGHRDDLPVPGGAEAPAHGLRLLREPWLAGVPVVVRALDEEVTQRSADQLVFRVTGQARRGRVDGLDHPFSVGDQHSVVHLGDDGAAERARCRGHQPDGQYRVADHRGDYGAGQHREGNEVYAC